MIIRQGNSERLARGGFTLMEMLVVVAILMLRVARRAEVGG